jgi:ubiquinone/menaquinone biosynthesis C-methylase UbiE
VSSEPIAKAVYETIADKFASEVDSNAFNAAYERPATLSLLPPVRGLRVLDAGCGPGSLSEWLVNQGASVVAVDVSPRMLAFARERLGDRVPLHEADLAKPLGFLSDQTFELVTCSLALDYLEDWVPTLREFARVLVPGGGVVFSIGHPMAEFQHTTSSNYFDVELLNSEWPSYRIRVPSYRRSFNEIFGSLAQAGLIVDRVLEPRPTPPMRERDPAAYARLSKHPWFLHLRARKPERAAFPEWSAGA